MRYTNNLKTLEGRLVKSVENYPERFVIRFMGEVDLDIRVDDNNKLSIGIVEPVVVKP